MEADAAWKHSDALHPSDDLAGGAHRWLCLPGTPCLPDLGNDASPVFYLVNEGGPAFETIGVHRGPHPGPVHIWMPSAQTHHSVACAHVGYGGPDAGIGSNVDAAPMQVDGINLWPDEMRKALFIPP